MGSQSLDLRCLLHVRGVVTGPPLFKGVTGRSTRFEMFYVFGKQRCLQIVWSLFSRQRVLRVPFLASYAFAL